VRALRLAVLLPACLPTGPSGEGEPTRTHTFRPSDGDHLDFHGGPSTVPDAWDLRLDGWHLFLNGGESGPGLAGGIDMELLDLDLPFEDMVRRNQVVWFLFYDSYGCALSDWWWYALDGTHTLFSNYHVYIVRRSERDFAVQILDYYRIEDGAPLAGYPEMRWVEIGADGPVGEPQQLEIDATAGGVAPTGGPEDRWTYFRFGEGAGPLVLDDTTSLQSPDWDLAWKRFHVKSNSGPSGPGGVLTTDWDRTRGETADEVLGFSPESEAAHFAERVAAWDPAGPEPFVEDHVEPVVRRWFQGQPGIPADPPRLDPGRWFIVVDRNGADVWKLRVTGFSGVDAEAADEVTVEWGLLP
jgi:hypothetical protein